MARHILVLGGGYAGLTVARRLARHPREVRVTLVNQTAYMTYQPLLPETAAGSVNPAHVVVPLRSALRGVMVIVGSLSALDTTAKSARVTTADGHAVHLEYDEVVLALGSVTRVLPVPGLVEHAVGFRSVEEALHLGSRVLSRLDAATTLPEGPERRRALTFVFVGGGYAGIEVLAEVEDMVRRTAHRYGLRREDTRWVLVEAADRILPQLPARLASYAAEQLTARDIEIRTRTTLSEIRADAAVLGDDSIIPTDTVVWTAGVVASPLLRHLGLPVTPAGRVPTTSTLRVDGVPATWALGDCAAVPDPSGTGVCPPTAQHAVRQAQVAADNILASVHRRASRSYRHRDAGAVASLGLGKGVAELYGVPVRGYLAWLIHRIYHGSRLPCGRRRLKVLLLWLLGAVGRDPVALSALESPRRPLEEAHLLQSAISPGS